MTMCQCLLAWLVLSAICTALFWAAAVLAGRDDDAHGRSN
jgi:hypothetical protein